MMVEPKIVLATRNAHKIEELRTILSPFLIGLDPDAIVGADRYDLPEPLEDEITFAGNALIKARQLAQATGLLTLADDSGICVDALGGAPGVFSARWCGKHGSDEENLALLLGQMRDVPQRYRGAAFKCAAAMVTPDGREFVEEAQMRGILLPQASGTNGFGYDPIFQPEGYEVSAAELSPEQKDAISHRGKAFRLMAVRVAYELGLIVSL